MVNGLGEMCLTEGNVGTKTWKFGHTEPMVISGFKIHIKNMLAKTRKHGGGVCF
jgi:hypothetical protein